MTDNSYLFSVKLHSLHISFQIRFISVQYHLTNILMTLFRQLYNLYDINCSDSNLFSFHFYLLLHIKFFSSSEKQIPQIIEIQSLNTSIMHSQLCFWLFPYKLVLQFYTCFDWFKKLRLFVNESNNIRRSQGVACRCHQVIFLNKGNNKITELRTKGKSKLIII